MPTNYEPLVLTIDPAYVGSAISPTVDITETSDDVTVTITDINGEHSYTIEKTDDAIAAAESAASAANSAADEAEAFLEGFTVEYANLSDECKETIAQAAGTGASVISDAQGIAIIDDMAEVIALGREAGTLTDEQGISIIEGIFA